MATTAPSASAPHEGPGRHRVRAGETLSGIAHQLGVSLDALVSANGLSDADLIVSGTSLRVPGPSSRGGGGGASTRKVHVVVAGETLSGIAKRHGVATKALAFANGLADQHLIQIGTRLVVPTSGGGGGGGNGPSSTWPKRLRQSPGRQAYIPSFDLWAAHYGVPADLLKAMTWLESGWQQQVVSHTGAIGIGQLMPDTVDFVSMLIGRRLDPWDPSSNIRMSARYLRFLLDATGGDPPQALAAYYQGLMALRTKGMYDETFAYVRSVLSLRPRF